MPAENLPDVFLTPQCIYVRLQHGVVKLTPELSVASADAAAVQQCWLRQGAGQPAEGPAVLMDTVQHAQGGAGFKYQDVVRRKADRAALEVLAI